MPRSVRRSGSANAVWPDADALTWWLVEEATQVERSGERVREHLLAELRRRKLEPPTTGRIDRIVAAGLSRGEAVLFDRVKSRLSTEVVARLVALVAPAADEAGELEGGSAVLASIRSDPGNVNSNTMLTEIAKLEAVREIGVPVEVFADIAPKTAKNWRARAAAESPSHLRGHPLPVKLIARYAGANLRYYPRDEAVPTHRGMSGDWAELVYQGDKDGHRRVVRMVYEIATFQALREQLRWKEIGVVGADKWRNPAQDLPTDFEERRVEHYGKLRKPLDPTEFIDAMCEEMRTELEALHAALPKASWLEIKERKQGAIKLAPLAPLGEPRNLRKL